MLGPAFLLLAAAFAVLSYRDEPIGPLTPETAAGLLIAAALAFVAARRIVESFREGVRQGVSSLVLWALAGGVIALAHANQGSLEEGAMRIAGEFAAGRPVAAGPEEAVVLRRIDGTFLVHGRANDREARFVFDTGASAVVLTHETAKALGIDPQPAEFKVPISTANGRAFAAPAVVDAIAVGAIVERGVPAYVARPGMLRENLLGMTFLDRLASYEVRGNRLLLRARAAPAVR